jgi:radical SAM protein with 4Fe4S-binding SPASM domain
MVGLDWDRVQANIAAYVDLWQKHGRPNKSSIVFVNNPLLSSADEVERVRALWAPSGLNVIIWGHLDRAGNNRLLLNQNWHAGKEGRVVHCKMGYMKNRVAIMYNGDVLLCCQDWSRKVVIGNIAATGSLAEVWNNSVRAGYEELIFGGVKSACDLPCLRCELATIV